MTYDQLIELVRNRGKSWLFGTPQWESGQVYDAVNFASREVGADSKPTQKTASLAITSGTIAYTISTAIGADVDEINFIRVGNAEIKPLSYGDFQNLTIDNVATETNTGTTDESLPNLFYNVVGDTLTLSFIPSQDLTATVEYTPKVIFSFYSTANGALTLPYPELFVNAILYEALATLSENLGLFTQGTSYRDISKMKVEEAKKNAPYYEFGSHIKFHDPVNG